MAVADGKQANSKATLARTTDFERDDILCLRLGANSRFNDKFTIRGEAALIAETTFSIAAGFEF